MNDVMVSVQGLSKRFDDCQALDGVNLTVPEGSVYGLVGPNGAGKSTLIHHITGSYRQDTGQVLVAGEPVYENNKVKAQIACIPGELPFNGASTVAAFARFYEGVLPNFSRERFEELGKQFDLDPKRPMRKFSKGMQKQAAFWLALSQCPRLLLLDEPLDGLDPMMRRAVWGLVMDQVAESGMTVLVSSHNLRELEGVCDHMGIMSKGSMLREYDLTRIEDGLMKVQIALPNGAALPDGLEVVHASAEGRLQTLIIRGMVAQVRERLESASPVLLEVVPLSLEELFLYELGGVSDDVKDLVL